ncbi:MAG TPA: hypothetical protein VEM15_11205 [Thermodesulfobacteriota bacterium]|nr:hypothetical protein [Thermodesulfobacteriota bacterium]
MTKISPHHAVAQGLWRVADLSLSPAFAEAASRRQASGERAESGGDGLNIFENLVYYI